MQDLKEDLFIKKEEKKECREFLNEIFMSLGLEKIRIIEKRIFYLTKNLQFFKEFYFLSQQALNYKQEKLIPKIQEKIKNSKWANHDLLRNFSPICHIQVGHKLESIPDIEKINGEKEIRQYNLEEGKVCLIYIWSYYKSICKKQLRYLNELFEKNNWEGNVKFFTLNSDANRENSLKFIRQLNLTKMEHFYIDIKKHPEHPIIKIGELHGYSSCILINNDNIIDSCGTLYEIDLEKRINLMLERNLSNSGTMVIPHSIDKSEKTLLKKMIANFEAFTIFHNSSQNSVFNEDFGGIESIEHQFFQSAKISSQNLAFKSSNSFRNNNNHNTNDNNNSFANNCSYNNELINNNNNSIILNNANREIKSQNTAKPEGRIYNSNKNINNIPSSGAEAPFICDIKNYKKKLSKTLSLDLINIMAPHLCEAKIVLNKIFPTGIMQKNNSNSLYSGEIDYKCHINDENQVLKLLRGIENIKNLQFTKNIIETVEFFYGESCCSCNAPLFEETEPEIALAQYYCPICDIYFCRDCGNHLTNINSNKKLHNHFLFFLNNQTCYFMKYILKHNLETDSEFEFKYFLENKNFEYVMKDLRMHYHIKCDGCFSYPIRTYRWKCCNCEYRNVCEICMAVIEKRKEPFASEIFDNLELAGCDPNSHVFMKIIFEAPLYK